MKNIFKNKYVFGISMGLLILVETAMLVGLMLWVFGFRF
jgi:hypothetical protein